MCIVIKFLVLQSICQTSLVHFLNSAAYLTRGLSRCLLLWWDFCWLPRSSKVFSSFFFHFYLFYDICLQYFQVFEIFFFFKRSDSFLIWQTYSFRYLFVYFIAFHFEHGSFFNVKFHFCIIVVYKYLLLFEFFTPTFADGFSLEFEWLQIFSFTWNITTLIKKKIA